MPKTLDGLPNELLEHITRYAHNWEKLPQRLSVYGVLARVNRRLRAFALRYLFTSVCLPVRKTEDLHFVLKPRPLAALSALLQSDPRYGQYVKHLLIGPRSYPSFHWHDEGPPVVDMTDWSWRFLSNIQSAHWVNLRSFTSLTITCTPATLQILKSCQNLTSLSMRWTHREFPDLSLFPRLESLRLVAKVLGSRKVGKRRRLSSQVVYPCKSLKTLAIHEGVRLPLAIPEQLQMLYPSLRVLVAYRTTLSPDDLLQMIAGHPGLKEVTADFGAETVPLYRLVRVACGHSGEPSQLAADLEILLAGSTKPHCQWTKILVGEFGFVRERNPQATARKEDGRYKITSLAIRSSYETVHDTSFDELTALLDLPAGFPYRDLRHFALTFGYMGTREFNYEGIVFVEDFMARLGTQLSQWTSLESFVLHHDLMDRQWHGPPKVPLLDDTDFPTRGSWANTDYPSLRNCLRYHHAALSDDEDEVVEELRRTLGREIDIDDDGVGIDQIWLDRHEPTIARGVRKMADMCPRLRYFQWFVDDGVPNLSYTYKIHRYTDGRGRMTTGQTSSLDCLKGEVLPFTVAVGQELQAAREAWYARLDCWG
ncbi:hypothetical protein EV121DRAFT_255272 [Schizophyllum commune]